MRLPATVTHEREIRAVYHASRQVLRHLFRRQVVVRVIRIRTRRTMGELRELVMQVATVVETGSLVVDRPTSVVPAAVVAPGVLEAV